ncbi:UDP-N-acetylglucosamine--N-acetylmuramyl-(pentapeptide) pyrophosphoryl-undecaprenol N-acetylglucosamine transferase [Rhodococcus gordoniae]|uniref:UDP-N-acetylglucosamine--N-acetylmuramyl- (pentapeptide) pyrophosphoryl-undecaprenol N-acetylglucosamine transferase n=1 Tax=Rhodococcus gordoniae TaxID=223392 RepID=UPI000AADA7D3|nr:UDP-N-acetylglucosamine--N-acetylmuramyl-(pentapeptide) pyrophosphoryl-undecaprenol N-acetylglucosamine transferase [Rhodococcus gordoniae]
MTRRLLTGQGGHTTEATSAADAARRRGVDVVMLDDHGMDESARGIESGVVSQD